MEGGQRHSQCGQYGHRLLCNDDYNLHDQVYPGVCSTNIKRHMGVDRSITGNIIANPLLWLLTRTAARGAQGVIWAATDAGLDKVTGKLFSSMEVRRVEFNIFHVFLFSLISQIRISKLLRHNQCCTRLLFLTWIDFVIKISGD